MTIGGCLLQKSEEKIHIFREERNLPNALCVNDSEVIYWDHRFVMQIGKLSNHSSQNEKIQPLGRHGWQKLVKLQPGLRNHHLPLLARYTLPALLQNGKIISVSHLTTYYPTDHPRSVGFENAVFKPHESLIGSMFSVALDDFCTISK
tara:strand:- start:53 stop:496 length:444 start_codon:yes stop_codon:yes gene_type:complete